MILITIIGGIQMHVIEEKGKLVYTIPEIAKLSGLSVSYLYRLSSEGKLPVCKVGTRCLIIVEDYYNWLRSKRRS